MGSIDRLGSVDCFRVAGTMARIGLLDFRRGIRRRDLARIHGLEAVHLVLHGVLPPHLVSEIESGMPDERECASFR